MKFLLLEQKYMEYLEDGKILDALKCLRNELAPLKFNVNKLHELSWYSFFSNSHFWKDFFNFFLLKKFSHVRKPRWAKADQQMAGKDSHIKTIVNGKATMFVSTSKIWKTNFKKKSHQISIQVFLPPNIMLPPRRLETLIMHGLEMQCEKCPYHNLSEKPSIESWPLLKDHICTK